MIDCPECGEAIDQACTLCDGVRVTAALVNVPKPDRNRERARAIMRIYSQASAELAAALNMWPDDRF